LSKAIRGAFSINHLLQTLSSSSFGASELKYNYHFLTKPIFTPKFPGKYHTFVPNRFLSSNERLALPEKLTRLIFEISLAQRRLQHGVVEKSISATE
jgi:hypothetical protein